MMWLQSLGRLRGSGGYHEGLSTWTLASLSAKIWRLGKNLRHKTRKCVVAEGAHRSGEAYGITGVSCLCLYSQATLTEQSDVTLRLNILMDNMMTGRWRMDRQELTSGKGDASVMMISSPSDSDGGQIPVLNRRF